MLRCKSKGQGRGAFAYDGGKSRRQPGQRLLLRGCRKARQNNAEELRVAPVAGEAGQLGARLKINHKAENRGRLAGDRDDPEAAQLEQTLDGRRRPGDEPAAAPRQVNAIVRHQCGETPLAGRPPDRQRRQA